MTILDMLGQSGILTMLGMGVVFGFLIIMVIVISLAGKIIQAAGLDNGVKPAVPAAVKPAVDTSAITAAISAAVNEYRKNN
jgi:oxaloacetate decarboxylase gamma subunit